MHTFVYMNRKEIGRIIKRSIKDQNLSEYKVAKETGIKIDTIKSIEDGNGCNVIKLLTLCAYLNIEMRLIQKAV